MKVPKGKNHTVFRDMLYSLIGYSLPTVVLQFAVQPLIAAKTSAEDNGLFVTMFTLVKLAVGVTAGPLASLRLLKKEACIRAPSLGRFFNWLFVLLGILAAVVVNVLGAFLSPSSYGSGDAIRLNAFLGLILLHDYYSIKFRLDLEFLRVVIDNAIIVLGFGLGIVVFFQTKNWEYIFICGYLPAVVYVLILCPLWRSGLSCKDGSGLFREYVGLGAASGLNTATAYFDKLIMFPMLGGFAVSTYNAAAIVSKVVLLVTTPVRNVILSHIVNVSDLSVGKAQLRKLTLWLVAGVILGFTLFCGGGFLLCGLLYPRYVDGAMMLIPVITLAVMLEAAAGVLNMLLLRLVGASLQVLISGIKLGVYLLAVLILTLVLGAGLWGFCWALLLAAATQLVMVVFHLRRHLVIRE